MRTSIILDVDDTLAEFIVRQGQVDPSALINKLVREQMGREGWSAAATQQPNPGTTAALEKHLDQDTRAAD